MPPKAGSSSAAAPTTAASSSSSSSSSKPKTDSFRNLPQISGVEVMPPQCSICMDDLFHLKRRDAERSCYSDDPKIGVLPECGHVFHYSCINEWFERMMNEHEEFPTCPLCRQGGGYEEMIIECKFAHDDDVNEGAGLGIKKWIHNEDPRVKEVLTLARELKELVECIESEANDDKVFVEAGMGSVGGKIDENLDCLLEFCVRGKGGFDRVEERVEELRKIKVKLERLWAADVLRKDIKAFNFIAEMYTTEVDRFKPINARLSILDNDVDEVREENAKLTATNADLKKQLAEAGQTMLQETRQAKEREKARWTAKMTLKEKELEKVTLKVQALKDYGAKTRTEMASLREENDQIKAEKSELALELREERKKFAHAKKKRLEVELKLTEALSERDAMKGRIGQLEEAGQSLERRRADGSPSDAETLEYESEREPTPELPYQQRQPTAREFQRPALHARNPFAVTPNQAAQRKHDRENLSRKSSIEVVELSSDTDDDAVQERTLRSGPRHKSAVKRKAEAPAPNQATGPKVRRKSTRI